MISKLRSTSWRTRRSATNRSKIQSSRIRLNVGDRLKNVVSLEPRIALWRHQNTVSASASMLSRILGLRSLLLDDIDRASEPIREQILHAHQIEQVECRGWIDVNQYIDVAVRPRLTTHDRPRTRRPTRYRAPSTQAQVPSAWRRPRSCWGHQTICSKPHAKPRSERNQKVPSLTIRALHQHQAPANGNSRPKPPSVSRRAPPWRPAHLANVRI